MIPAPVSKSRSTPTLNETSEQNTFSHQANQRDSYIPSWSREAFSISFCSLSSFDFIEDVCRSLLIAFLGSSSFRKKEGSLTNKWKKGRVATETFTATFKVNLMEGKINNYKTRITFDFPQIGLPFLDLLNKKPSGSQLVSIQPRTYFNRKNYPWNMNVAISQECVAHQGQGHENFKETS